MGAEICQPAHHPDHQAALAQSAKYEETGGKNEQHSDLASHEFGYGQPLDNFPGVPGDGTHAVLTVVSRLSFSMAKIVTILISGDLWLLSIPYL